MSLSVTALATTPDINQESAVVKEVGTSVVDKTSIRKEVHKVLKWDMGIVCMVYFVAL